MSLTRGSAVPGKGTVSGLSLSAIASADLYVPDS